MAYLEYKDIKFFCFCFARLLLSGCMVKVVSIVGVGRLVGEPVGSSKIGEQLS